MKEIKNGNVPFLSFEKTREALDCSRSFMYNLINDGTLKPKYLGKKPYFMIEDIVAAMTEKPQDD
jgi:predicted DNA-binding transcriptional regulator AlpA